jgi:hypothetical protein
MTDNQLYFYSKRLHSLHDKVKDFMHYYYYRYGVLVDRSDQGLKCRYAIITKKFGEDEEPEFRDYLISLKTQLDQVIKELDQETEASSAT